MDDATGGTGPRPTEVLAVAIGGCTATDVDAVRRLAAQAPTGTALHDYAGVCIVMRVMHGAVIRRKPAAFFPGRPPASGSRRTAVGTRAVAAARP